MIEQTGCRPYTKKETEGFLLGGSGGGDVAGEEVGVVAGRGRRWRTGHLVRAGFRGTDLPSGKTCIAYGS